MRRMTLHSNTDLEIRKSVRCFQCRNDALQPGHMLERFQRLSIGHCVILSTPDVAEVAVLRAYTRVIQPTPVYKTALKTTALKTTTLKTTTLKTTALRMAGRRMSAATGHDLAGIR